MATLNTLEGLSDATTVTTGNSGGASGNAFSAVNGGALVSARSAAAMTGSMGLRCATVASTTAYVTLSTADGVASSGQWFMDAQIKCVTALVNGRIIVFEDGPGAFQAEIRTTTGGRLELRDFNSSTVATTANPGDVNGNTFAYVAGTGFRLGMAILVYSATVGQIEMKIWNAAGVLVDRWRSTANLDTLRGGGAGRIRVGVAQGVANRTIELDDLGTSTTGYPFEAGGADPAEGTANAELELAVAATGHADHTGTTGAVLALDVAAAGARDSAGTAAAGLALAVAVAGATEHRGTAAAGLALAVVVAGHTDHAGAADASLVLEVDVAGIAPGVGSAEGTADLGLALQVAASGARRSAGTAAAGIVFTVNAVGSSPARGTAALELVLAVAAEAHTGDPAGVFPPLRTVTVSAPLRTTTRSRTLRTTTIG